MTGVWNGEQLVSNKTELQTRLIQHIVKDRIHKGTATDLINNLTTTDVRTCPHVKYNDKFSMSRDRLIVIILCVCVCVCVRACASTCVRACVRAWVGGFVRACLWVSFCCFQLHQ